MWPSTTISGAAPSGRVITGVPQAAASVNTRPKGSGQSMGHTTARARPRSATFTAWGGCSITCTSSESRGRTTCSQYAHSSGSSRFTIIMSGSPALRATSIATSGPLSGFTRPRKTRKSSLRARNGWVARSTPLWTTPA